MIMVHAVLFKLLSIMSKGGLRSVLKCVRILPSLRCCRFVHLRLRHVTFYFGLDFLYGCIVIDYLQVQALVRHHRVLGYQVKIDHFFLSIFWFFNIIFNAR